MKKGILIFGVFVSALCTAQKNVTNAKNIILNKGQQITITSSATAKADMGMGMGMNSTSSTINKLSVLEIMPNDYKVASRMTKMLFNAEMMGQQQHFDSDKKEDRESEFGKTVSSALDTTKLVLVNKKTGSIESQKDDNNSLLNDSNPMSGMLGAMATGGENAIISGAFFLVPANKKIGDKWSDSSSIEGMKTVNNYSIESVEKNIVTVLVNTSVTGNTTMEAQGTELKVDLNTVSSGRIILDSNTSLVKKRITNAEINSNIEMMGQSLPVTGTATSTIIYE
ncbi:MAG: DUF6263 family protein [Ferruginibacter sp.]